MRHARRFIAILVGGATWCMVATTVAHAAMLHDPVPAVPAAPVVGPSNGATVGTPFWENAATTVLGVLLVLAVTGLVFALRHPRRPEHSRRSKIELHA
jgi:hypothetical protein